MWVASIVLAGCLAPNRQHCASGLECPAGQQCIPAGDGCAPRENIAACSGREDGSFCSTSIADGVCGAGVCQAGCGDGVLAPDEGCETAANLRITCDELGFYGGLLTCAADCTYDDELCEGFCGDGVRNGPEDCDQVIEASQCVDLGYDRGTLSCALDCNTDLAACGTIGVSAVPGLGGQTIRAIGGTSGEHIVVATDSSFIRFDGRDWQVLLTAEESLRIRKIWFNSPSEGIAVGTAGVWRYDGSGWTKVYQPEAELVAVWGSGDKYYAVGARQFVHFDGTTWSSQPVPGQDLADFDLSAIWGRSESEIIISDLKGTLYTFDGQGWGETATVATGNGAAGFVHALWGTGDELFISGQLRGVQRLHYDQSANEWQWQDYPADVWRTFLSAESLGGSAASDVYALGSTFLVHFDGQRWQSMALPTKARGMAVVGPWDVFIGGDDGRVFRYQGSAWSEPAESPSVSLSSVWSAGPNHAMAVAKDQVELYNESGWTTLCDADAATPAAACPFDGYTNLWGRAADDIYALAWEFGPPGQVLHFNGATWSSIHTTGETGLQSWRAMSGGPTSLFLVGTFGMVEWYDGAQWNFELLGGLCTVDCRHLKDVWAASDSFAVAVDSFGGIWRYDGLGWQLVFETQRTGNTIWGAAEDDIFVGTNWGNGVWHFDGAAWTLMLDSPSAVTELAGSGSDDVFAIGGSALWHYDGARWSRVRTPSGLSGAHLAANGRQLFAVGVPSVGSGRLELVREASWVRHSFEDCSNTIDDDCDGRIDSADSACP